MKIRGKSRGNPFACLGSTPPEHYPPNNMMLRQPPSKQTKSVPLSSKSSQSLSPLTTNKTVPPIPSLHLAAKSLLTCEPYIESHVHRDYDFVFKSRRIDSCDYEPYKVLLFIASAQGYHHKSNDDIFDPRLSADGVLQSKIVSAALRRAKQTTPDLIYCSTMYRALSSMQLVCPDWYDEVKMVALDELRPRYDGSKSSKRSNVAQLNRAFKRVSFDYVAYNEDHLWHENQCESDYLWKQRIHEFCTKYLIPQSELIETMYGTVKCSKLDNVGWKSSKTNTPTHSVSRSPPPPSKYSQLFKKRVVVVSHCEFFEDLLRNVLDDDASSELCKKWKHGDIRKVFVYTKQQLGQANIPFTRSISPHPQALGKSNRKRSKSPFGRVMRSRSRTPKRNRLRESEPERRALSNPSRKDIASRSKGVILMTTNKSFESHRFTLTTMSAALINTQKVPTARMRCSKSADNALIKKRHHPQRQMLLRNKHHSARGNITPNIDVCEEESSDGEYLIEDVSESEEDHDQVIWNKNNNNNTDTNANKYNRYLNADTHQQRKHIIVITPPT